MKKKNTPLLYASFIFLAAVLNAMLLYWVQTRSLETYRNKLPFVSLGNDLKFKTTQSHLWLEEYLSGDTSINYQETIGKSLQEGIDKLEKLITHDLKGADQSDAEQYALMELTLNQLITLNNLSNKRYEAFTVTGNNDQALLSKAGSELDTEFDKAYEELMKTLEILSVSLQADLEEDLVEQQILLSGSVIFLILIAVAISVFVYRVQLKNITTTHENEVKLDTELTRGNHLQQFVERITEGEFNAELTLNIEQDLFAASLVQMKDRLHRNELENKRRNWTTLGEAQIGEILRKQYQKLDDLYDAIIGFVVKYTNSNQGALFLTSNKDNGRCLEMVSCYAYNRKKFLNKLVYEGEGLAGQCLLEKDVIYITDVPRDYVQISSGMGQATPTAVLIVPLLRNDEIQGVLEIASFKPYEAHEIDLIKRFAETVASSVATVRINEQTQLLLAQAQLQAEQMKSQEEEMRQNLEELAATQEEMHRKEQEYLRQLKQFEEKEMC